MKPLILLISGHQSRRNRRRLCGRLVAAGHGVVKTGTVLAWLWTAGVGWAEEAETRASGAPPSVHSLADMSLEQLANLEVTSVSKHREKLSAAPAAVFVITQEDIRRSGVTSIPEALRLAPGLAVARADGNTLAISARGFNDVYANKLLVVMDGRSVYTPLFSGVLWDAQDTMLEDIERIEVVRGPGATWWGANAVNGEINISTKKAKDTQGLLLTGGGGTEETGFGGVRYGVKLADEAWLRIYGKYFSRDDSALASGQPADDAWQAGRGGFRLDWEPSVQSTFTLQGEAYGGTEEEFHTYGTLTPPYQQSASSRYRFQGGNVVGRWTRSFSDTADLQFQTYFDRTMFDGFTLRETRNTYDADLSHHLTLGRHNLVSGLGYRVSSDDIESSAQIALQPAQRTTHLVNAYVQDEIALVPDRLHLTLGSKFEHNDYTGFEIQPGARLTWTPQDRQTVWASVARAVRTPSRVESDGRIQGGVLPPGPPGPPVSSGVGVPLRTAFFGSPDYHSESLIAYELGYRLQPMEQLAFDFAAFFNDYDDLRSFEQGTPSLALSPTPHLQLPVRVGNNLYGETYGFEGVANLRLAAGWRVQASYSLLKMNLHTRAGSTDTTSESAEGASPQHQFGLRLSFDLPAGVELDTGVRYVGALPGMQLGHVFGFDVRLAWRPTKHLEFAIVGQDLAYRRHAEFLPSQIVPTQPTQMERAVYGKITLRF